MLRVTIFKFSELDAVITGSDEQLALIGDSIPVPIDVSGIDTLSATRNIDIPVERGLSISRKSVSVEITPILASSDSSSSTNRSQGSEKENNTNTSFSTTNSKTSSSSQQSESSQGSESSVSSESTSSSTQISPNQFIGKLS